MTALLLSFLTGAVTLTPATAAENQPEKNPPEKREPSPQAGRNTPAAKPAVDFEKEIRPLFAAHCVQCHGPKKQEGGLRLDHRSTALRGGDSGKVVIPGDSAKSEIIRRVTAKDESERMPPVDAAVKPLTPAQIALLRRWIDAGAPGPDDGNRLTVKSDHWAYQPVRDVTPPMFTDTEARQWIRNPIDAFVLARLRKKGIVPSPPADKYTLIKRLYYDLIGLPPRPEDVDAFVKDSSPDAYEKLVDRLLNSKHFGERWGRHWLDKARYADSDGYEKDRPRPNAWRYRDWVIDAINRDMPFDEFTRQQLAGDLLPGAGPMEKLATAFHRQTLTNTEGGTDKEQFRVEAVFDRVDTTGTVWLGLTVGCAKCHSHKYDPLTQAEYYQMFAFFNNGDETTTQVPVSEAAVKEYERNKAAYEAQRKQLTQQFEELKRRQAGGLTAWEKETRAKLAQEAKNVIRYHALKITGATSRAGAKLSRQKDGSLLVGGSNPDGDVYTLKAAVPSAAGQAVTRIRLEALTDKSLGRKGPGRTPHGNFVLSRFRLFVVPADGKEREVIFSSATADFSQKKFSPAGALNDQPRTGWAISPQMGKPHWIEFRMQTPLALHGDETLRVVLEQTYGGRHTLGRFRLQAVTGTQPRLPIPEDVRRILAVVPEKRTAAQRQRLLTFYTGTLPAGRKLNEQLTALKKREPKPPVMTVRVISQRTNNPRTTHLFRRGDFLQPQEEVQPGTFAVLHPFHPRRKDGPADRLDLANWLMDPANPLTPRVTVNHIWQHLFGEGLVSTMNDFGVRGEKPTHPLLLDWLAKEFIRRQWSRKAMIKLIVMSATYRQSSRHRPELATIDPQNKLLARQNRFRVEAEIVRDIYLEAAGLLSKKVGGPSVFPPMPADVAALSYAGNFKWVNSEGPDRYRRGMYTFFKRTAPHPMLVTFDCPDSNTTKVKRRTSNTPLMALTTLNNMVFVEAAQALAKRVQSEPALQTDEDRIVRMFRLCVARPPSAEETEALHRLLEESRRWYATRPKEAARLVGAYQPQHVSPAEAAAWVATARIVLNTDEFLTRE